MDPAPIRAPVATNRRMSLRCVHPVRFTGPSCGYEGSEEEFTAAMRRVLYEQKLRDLEEAQRRARVFSKGTVRDIYGVARELKGISARRLAAAVLHARGMDHREIARRLRVTAQTVRRLLPPHPGGAWGARFVVATRRRARARRPKRGTFRLPRYLKGYFACPRCGQWDGIELRFYPPIECPGAGPHEVFATEVDGRTEVFYHSSAGAAYLGRFTRSFPSRYPVCRDLQGHRIFRKASLDVEGRARKEVIDAARETMRATAARHTRPPGLMLTWRTKILARTGTRCAHCGRDTESRQIVLAHITPVLEFKECYPTREEAVRASYRYDNLVMLCRRCHALDPTTGSGGSPSNWRELAGRRTASPSRSLARFIASIELARGWEAARELLLKGIPDPGPNFVIPARGLPPSRTPPRRG